MTRLLTLPAVPVQGPDGRRDNLERVRVVVGAMLPAGTELVLGVGHNEPCPCGPRAVSLDLCTCDTVDLTLSVAPEHRS